MPIIKAAKKALRTSRKRNVKNNESKAKLKDAIKKISEKTINETFSLVDKAVKNNLIHKNKASRIKSSLAKKIGKTPKSDKPVKSKVATKKATKTAKK